ncbi:MAG: DUF3782 domain-containing protein [Chloroflexi bacterium]|nr:MAG: DUF3782 domain-containing protein [Chloroflexota bacterium]
MAEQITQEAVAEIWQLFKETDAKFKETDAKFKETDAKIQETTRQIRALEGLFGSQWGKFIEALVHPNALRLFQAWGIQVHYVYRRAISQFNGEHMELDLLLENDEDVIVVEVKSTLKVQDINDFLDELKDFLRFFPKYANRRIYGAVAGLSIEEDADRFAYRKGLFVLGVVGGGIVQIKNDRRFRPHDFATDE